jgi:hypothetical protein
LLYETGRTWRVSASGDEGHAIDLAATLLASQTFIADFDVECAEIRNALGL